MIRKITNLDNHHLRDFFTNPEKLCFLIQLMYNYNFFFPGKVIYMLRDFFILRFEFYYNSFSYFFSLVVSVWRISDLSFKNIDELITFKHVGYKRDKLYFLSPFYYNIPAPKFNTRFPSRFIFLLLQHTVHDYRVWFKHGIYRFRLQKFFKITTEYNIVFKEYHSKFRDELHFENKYKPYLFKLTNMVYKHKLNDFSLLKKKSLIYLEHKKLMSFIKIRNFFNITLLFMPFMLPFPFISSFCFSERQLKFLFFILLIIKTRSLVDSIFLSNQLYVSGLRERYECSVHLLQKQLKRWLSWKTFLVFNFIVNENIYSRPARRRYKRITKIVRIIRTYRFIKKLVIWNWRIFKHMFLLFYWLYFTIHLLKFIDLFIEFHFITEERVFFLIYEYLQRKYKEIYDFFYPFG